MYDLIKDILCENTAKEIIITNQIFAIIKNESKSKFILPERRKFYLDVDGMPNHAEFKNLIKIKPEMPTYDGIINYVSQLLELMPPIIDFVYEQCDKN